MRLDDFLKNAERAELAPTKPVRFKAIGLTKDRQPIAFEVDAQLVFVDEDVRMDALRKAREQESSEYLINLATSYNILLVALRDADNPVVQFANDVTQLKKALVSRVAVGLMNDYQAFLQSEFPDAVSPDDAGELAREAEKNS